MAIVGIFTDVGISEAMAAQSNQGFKIFPTGFTVSNLKTIPLVPSITTPNGGVWFTGAISSRVVVDPHTIKFICTIPPGVIPPNTFQTVREIYLNGTDSFANTFIFAVGQPTTDIIYDPTGSVTLELELSLTNVSIVDFVVFSFTQATEVEEHDTDPNAHEDTIRAVNKAGIYQVAGGEAFRYAGQDFDDQRDFQGTKSQSIYDGVTFRADHTGPQWNGIQLTFNGTATVNSVVQAWNAANPTLTIGFTPSLAGTQVPPAGTTPIFAGGTLAVSNNDFVYLDTDGFYKQAIDDGTRRSKVAGVADTVRRIVRGGAGGFIGGAVTPFSTGQPAGTDLFLSPTVAGAYTTTPTATQLATVMDQYTIKLAGGGGSGSGGIGGGYDAVVSDSPGFHFYPTTQQAIAAVTGSNYAGVVFQGVTYTAVTAGPAGNAIALVFNGTQSVSLVVAAWNTAHPSNQVNYSPLPSGSNVPTAGTAQLTGGTFAARILVDKYEAVITQIDTQGKQLTFVVNGPDRGWTRYTGSQEQQKISFSQVPNSGTWRIEWNLQVTTDLAYNASNAAIQAAFNLLTGHNGVTVTGDYVNGILITFNDFANYPLVTFTSAGANKRQRLTFSDVPDDGTFQLTFNAQTTIHIAWNDSLAEVQADVSALSSVQSCLVTGAIGSQLTLEFQGPDGLQPQNDFTVPNNTLTKLGSGVTIMSSVLQLGLYPADNLKNGANHVVLTVQQTQLGNPIGPDEMMDITADGTRILGNGTVNNFVTAFDLNGHVQVDIEANFKQVTYPVLNAGLSPIADYHIFKSFGVKAEVVRTVGTTANPGDYDDIDTAYAAASDGDRILVLADQTVAAAKTWNKNITIEFIEGARLLLSAAVVGPVFTFGGRIKTRRLWVLASGVHTYSKMFLFQDYRSHHSDMQLEMTGGAGQTVTNAFEMDTSAKAVFVDAALIIGTGACPNPLVNSSGNVSSSVTIRDLTNGTTHDLVNRTPPVQETPVGVVDGVNTIFLLSQKPNDPTSIIVFVDRGPVPITTGWSYNPAGPSVVFTGPYVPTLGQKVYVWYQPSNLFETPVSGVATPLQITRLGETILFETQVSTIDLAAGLTATLLGPGQVQIGVAAGGGLGTWTVEYHTLSAPEVFNKQFTMANTPNDPANMLANDLSGEGLVYGTDFTVAVNVFDWTGLALDGTAAAGDVIRMAYFR